MEGPTNTIISTNSSATMSSATVFDSQAYKDLIQRVSRFNKVLRDQRANRLPFIDGATNVAQVPGLLHRQNWQRIPCENPHQAFRYLSPRWKKRKLTNSSVTEPLYYTESLMSVQYFNASRFKFMNASTPSRASNPNLYDMDDSQLGNTLMSNEWNVMSEFHLSDDNSDADENTSKRKKRSNGANNRVTDPAFVNVVLFFVFLFPQSLRSSTAATRRSVSSMLICNYCGSAYRTRSGLTNHINAAHRDDKAPSTTQATMDSQPPPLLEKGTPYVNNRNGRGNAALEEDDDDSIPPPTLQLMIDDNSQGSSTLMSAPFGDNSNACTASAKASGTISSGPTESWFCDICQQTEVRPRGCLPVQAGMAKCSDCKRLAHFGCLKFTPEMIHASQSYPWQCIECKTCWICLKAENDEKILFCDDCDRGYHLYCLQPPLLETPPGNWSCLLCVRSRNNNKEDMSLVTSSVVS